MVIEVRFFASLRRYVPTEPSGIISVDTADDMTVEELLHQLEVDPSQVAGILINGREGRLSTPLLDGDRLGLYPLGGVVVNGGSH